MGKLVIGGNSRKNCNANRVDASDWIATNKNDIKNIDNDGNDNDRSDGNDNNCNNGEDRGDENDGHGNGDNGGNDDGNDCNGGDGNNEVDDAAHDDFEWDSIFGDNKLMELLTGTNGSQTELQIPFDETADLNILLESLSFTDTTACLRTKLQMGLITLILETFILETAGLRTKLSTFFLETGLRTNLLTTILETGLRTDLTRFNGSRKWLTLLTLVQHLDST